MGYMWMRTLRQAYILYLIEILRQQIGLIWEAARANIEQAVNAFKEAGLIQ